MSTNRSRGARYRVIGRTRLTGSVQVSGAKNAALAQMCAGLLTEGEVVLANVPHISDADSLAELIQSLGASATRRADGAFVVSGANVSNLDVPSDLITENRASFQVIGPLLARHGYASSAPPGGDVIGQRPIDVHFVGFEAMGAEVERSGDRYILRAPNGLHGARMFMDYPSVTGTQNVMMAAVLAKGHSTIVNAATEPEVQDLGKLLIQMGARISGLGTQMVEIDGVETLQGTTLTVMPDRIEAGTFAAAAVMSNGELEIRNAPVSVMDAVIAKLRATGASITVTEDALHVACPGKPRAVSFQALPYPGLPTDLHAPMAAMLTQASGVSIIHERVFDNRMLYVGELRKLGAEIVSAGSTAIISGGGEPLHGARVRALDVRAGAAVLLGAIVADGETIIEDIYHLDRGYEFLDRKLRALGVQIERI